MKMTFAGGPLFATALDWFERLAIFALFSWVVWGMYSSGQQGWFPKLYFFSEGLVVLFILIRRPATELTSRLGDWGLAIGATVLPMLVKSGAQPLISPDWAMVIVVSGILVQLSAKLMLRRSFGVVAANRGVKIGGPYRLVRHPMYLGYLITHIGMLILSPLPWNLGLYAGAWVLQIARLLAEEKLLGQDTTYQAYAARVRYRLIPGVF